MTATIQKVDPVWGVTLRPGYCGFITREKDFVGDGIEWFERFEDSGGLPFCHAFAVAAPLANNPKDATIIEAHARTGVRQAQLSEYFNDPTCQCFIRVPRGYTDALGAQIVAGMVSQLGDKYGYGLIVADLLANTFAGHVINACTGGVPDKLMRRLVDNQHTRICSEAVACALKGAMPEGYLLSGCLKQPADSIDPKLLGNDLEIWEPTIYRIA
jgi:hypothetical protein